MASRSPRRKPLNAVENVIGVGLVFPRSVHEPNAGVTYVAAPLAAPVAESVEPEELREELESPEDDQAQLG
jgi:hypothetical protein